MLVTTVSPAKTAEPIVECVSVCTVPEPDSRTDNAGYEEGNRGLTPKCHSAGARTRRGD